MHHFAHHIGDYAAATAHLSWDEDMAYTRLMRVYYQHEKPIPADLAQACRLARCVTAAQRKAVETVLNEFFVLEDDGWHQKRCDEEIAEYQETAEKNRANGRKGGRPKQFQGPDVPHGTLANGNPKETQSVLSLEPSGFDLGKPNVTQTKGNQNQNQNQEQQQGGSPGVDPPPNRSESIPFQRIVEVYNATMTGLPKVSVLTDKRKKLMRSFWQLNPQFRSVEFVQQYFEECADDPFHNGTGPYGNGHEGWRPDFDYLMRQSVVVKLYERALSRGEKH